MQQEIYYITQRLLWQQPVSSFNGCLLLHIASDHDFEHAYRFAGNLPKGTKFGLLLPAELMDQSTGSKLVPFFFLPHYISLRNHPVVFIPGNATPGVQEMLQPQVQAQGINLHIRTLSTTDIFLTGQQQEIRRSIRKLLFFEIPAVFVQVDQWKELDKVQDLVVQENEICRNENPAYYQLLQEHTALRHRMEQLERVVAAAEQEIENHRSHLHILQSGTQAAELQRFYDNEYEVLPRWYKQVGHIIKVLSGRRRFKSLFNDQEKKYKS